MPRSLIRLLAMVAATGVAGCQSDPPMPTFPPVPDEAALTRALGETQAWLADHPDDPARGEAYLRRGLLLERLGREEDARASYELAAAAPPRDTRNGLMDASNTVNRAVSLLAAIHERRGRWGTAREILEGWTPTSWCGNEVVALEDDRARRIARCRFEVGEPGPALESLREIVVREASLNGFDERALLVYAELAARAGRLPEARATAESLRDPADRTRAFEAMTLAEAAFVRSSAQGILAAIRDVDPEDTEVFSDGSGSVPPLVEAAGEFLGRLGEPARRHLAERIAHGDVHAILVTGAGGLSDLRPDLERRLAEGVRSTERRRIAEALFRLSRAHRLSTGSVERVEPHAGGLLTIFE